MDFRCIFPIKMMGDVSSSNAANGKMMSNEMEIDTEEIIIRNKGKGKPIDSTLPFVEKYRPAQVTLFVFIWSDWILQLSGLISHKDILSTLEKFIAENKLPHLLFYGPPGSLNILQHVAFLRHRKNKYNSSLCENVVRRQIQEHDLGGFTSF